MIIIFSEIDEMVLRFFDLTLAAIAAPLCQMTEKGQMLLMPQIIEAR